VASFLRSVSLLTGALGPWSHRGLGKGTLPSSFKFYFRLDALQRDSSYQHKHVTVEIDEMTLYQALEEPLVLFSLTKTLRSQHPLNSWASDSSRKLDL
jgi:hypothetical protein